jgi:hypothetical protein
LISRKFYDKIDSVTQYSSLNCIYNISSTVQWLNGTSGDGRSCDEICGDNDKTCSVGDLCIATGTQLTHICNELGFDIDASHMGSGWDVFPFYYSGECYGFGRCNQCSSDCHTLSCSTSSVSSVVTRICPCVSGITFIKDINLAFK